MVSKGKSSIGRGDAKSLVANVLDSIPGRNKEETDDIVQALVERSGMLRPSGDERIDFIHNTLKEYLAAGCVVESGEWQILTKRADDPAWQPVILFALALAPESFSSGLVKDLLLHIESIKSPGKKTGALTKSERKALANIKARQFFLVRCQAVAKRLASDLSATINAFLVDLLPPSSMNEAEALAQLGSRVLNYGSSTLENSQWWASQNCYMAIRCLRLLRMVGGKKAKAALNAIERLPSYSSQLNNEWYLACNELSPNKRLRWPFIEKMVNLSSSRITDINLLEDLTEMESLDLDGTKVSSLRPICNMKGLKKLHCRYTRVIDLTPISDFTMLEELLLNNTLIEDIDPLKNLLALHVLSLRKTKVSDLSALANLKKLVFLDLTGTNVEDFTDMAKLSSLQFLDVSGTNLTDLSALTSLVSLKTLILEGILANDLSPLASLQSLEKIELFQINVTDLNPLAEIKTLKNIILGKTAILKQDLESFKLIRPDIRIETISYPRSLLYF